VEVAQRSRVRVVNVSSVPIQSFVVVDAAGRQFELGPIRAGGSVSRLLPLEGEGGVRFRAISAPQGSPTFTNGNIDVYITGGGTGEDITVTANPDGSFAVR
jgi:hypothetical protein